MTKIKFRKVLSLVLAFVMTASLFSNWPMPAFATDGTDSIILDFVPENSVLEVESLYKSGTIRNDSIKLYKSTDYGAEGVEVKGVQGVVVTVLTSHTIDNIKLYRIEYYSTEENIELSTAVSDNKYEFVSSTDIMLEGEESLPAPTPYPAIIPSKVINEAYNKLLATTTSADYDSTYGGISAEIINLFSAEQKAAVELHKSVLVAYETLMATETVASYDSIYYTLDPEVIAAFTEAQNSAVSAHREELYAAENPDTGIYLELPQNAIAQADAPSGALASINGTSLIAYKSLDNGAMGVEIPVDAGTVIELITKYTFDVDGSQLVFYRYDYTGTNETLKNEAYGDSSGHVFIAADSVTITNEVGTNSYTNEEFGITVSGQIPTGLTLKVAPEDTDAVLAGSGALMGGGEWTYDVDLTYPGGEYKTTQGINVTFEKENIQFPAGAQYKAYHIKADNSVEVLGPFVYDGNDIALTFNGLSPVGLSADAENINTRPFEKAIFKYSVVKVYPSDKNNAEPVTLTGLTADDVFELAKNAPYGYIMSDGTTRYYIEWYLGSNSSIAGILNVGSRYLVDINDIEEYIESTPTPTPTPEPEQPEEVVNAYENLIKAPTLSDFDDMLDEYYDCGVSDLFTDEQWDEIGRIEDILCDMEDETEHWEEYSLTGAPSVQGAKLYLNPVTWPDKYVTINMDSMIASLGADEVFAENASVEGEYTAENGDVYYIIDTSAWAGFTGKIPYKYIHKDNFTFANQWRRVNGKAKFATDSVKVYDNSLSTYYQMSNSTDLPVFDVYYSFLQNVDGIGTLWYVVDSTGWTDTYGNTVRGKFVKAADVNLITEETINTAYNNMLSAATIDEFDSLYSAAQTNGIIDCLTDTQKQALADTRTVLAGMAEATTDLSQYELPASFANEETKLYPNPVTQPDTYITAVVKEEQPLLANLLSTFPLFLTAHAAEEEVTAQEIIITGKYLADDGTLYYILDVSSWEGLDGIETIYVKASEIDIYVDEATQTTFIDLLAAQSGEELAEMLAELDDNTVAVMTEAGLVDLAESHAEVIEFLAENGSTPITDESVVGMYGQPLEGLTEIFLYAKPGEATEGYAKIILGTDPFTTPFKILDVVVDENYDVVYYQMNHSYSPNYGESDCSWIRADAVEILEDYVDPTEALYLKLMQTETLEEWNAVEDSVTDEQWTTINFSAEQQTALDEHLANLPTALEKEYSETTTELLKAETVADYMELVANVSEEVDAMILADSEMEDRLIAHIDALVAAEDTSPKNVTNYTNAAPLGEPVVGAAPVTTYSLLQRRSLPMLLADDTSAPAEQLTQVDGVVTDKKVALSTENAGYYTVTLETYVTGEKVTQRIEKHIPTDIIVVVDQSGSMANSMINEVKYEDYKTKIPNITASQIYGNYNNYETRNNTYVKVGDKYVKVTIERETVRTDVNYSTINMDNNDNEDFYDDYGNRGTLYYDVNGTKLKVYVTREFTSRGRQYTYTDENGTLVHKSDEDARYDTPPVQFYRVSSTTPIYGYKFIYTGADGTPVTHTYNADDAVPTGNENPAVAGGAYYYRTIVSTQPRLTALTNALTNFVKKVEEKTVGPDNIKGNADDVNHRIAIVGFSSDGYSNTEVFTGENVNISTGTEWEGNTAGNSKFYPTGYAKNGVQYAEAGEAGRTNYINATKTALVDVSSKAGDADNDGTYDGFENVNEAIRALTAEGGTYTDDGTQMALDIWANDTYELAAGEQRNRVVVIFTDGTPGLYSSSFDYTIATNAIEDTKKMKAATTANGYGATVYTVGIFDDADGTINVTNGGKNAAIASDLDANEFMHYMSNNYKNADGFYTPNDPTFHQVKQGTEYLYSGKSFYLSAGDSDALNNIFETISEDVQNESKSYELDETTVIKDIVAPNFLVPTNADTNTIKVYTALTTGTRTPTADNPEAFTFDTPVDVTKDVNVSINGKNVDIKGFDFAENWVGEIINNGVVTGYHGSKLIIKFDIPVHPDFIGGNKVKTNGDASGVYVPVIGEDGNPTGEYTLVENFVRPTVDIDIKPITPSWTPQHIYSTNNADILALFTGATINNKELSRIINKENNAYVTIEFVISDENGKIATYTVPAGEQFGDSTKCIVEMEAGKTLTPMLTEDTKYTFSWTITPTEPGTYTAKTGSAEAWVYVYNPTITFNDEVAYFGGVAANVEDNASTTITWDHNGTADTAMSANASKPSLDKFGFIYSYDTAAFVNGYTVKTGDIKVDVTKVTLNGTDITEDAKFAHGTCPEECSYVDTDTEEFRVHVKTATLTISKTVDLNGSTEDPKNSFGFKVVLTHTEDISGKTAYLYTIHNATNDVQIDGPGVIMSGDQITLKDNQYATIVGLPMGGYEVIETPNDAYATTSSGAEGTFSSSNLSAIAAFTNTLQTGTLVIEKVVAMPSGFAVTAGEKFNFTITGTGYSSTATITVDANGKGSVTIPNLVHGIYTVTENLTDDQKVLYTATGGTQKVQVTAGGEVKAIVTNEAIKGGFSVEKEVSGEAQNYKPATATEEFEMQVTVNGYTGGVLSYTIEGDTNNTIHSTDAKGVFKLKHGQKAIFSNLLVGSKFTVAENLTDSQKLIYKTTIEADDKTIAANETEEVVVTNTVMKGNLKIDKTVVMPDGFSIPEGIAFKFEVLDSENSKVTEVTLSADNDWTTTISDLLVGDYIIKEVMTDDQMALYTVDDAEKEATITDGGLATVGFTNTANTASLIVEKIVQDPDYKDEEFEIVVTVDGVKKTVTLGHNESKTISGLPVGAEYSVTENLGEKAGYYNVTYSNNSTGTIKSDDTPTKVVVTNSRKLGKLTITKEIDGADANPGETFVFTVTKPDGTTMEVVIAGEGSVVLTNMPLGTYTVAEDMSWAYKYTADPSSKETTITAESDGNVTIVNKPKADKWLKADAYVENVFTAVSVPANN